MKRGSLWKQICTILDQDKVMADVIAKGMVKKMGSGGSTMFWKDTWLGNSPLGSRFLRLFSISIQKFNKFVDMGCWDGARWCLNFQWRRQLFSW